MVNPSQTAAGVDKIALVDEFGSILELSTLFDADGDNTAQAVKTRPGDIYFIEASNPNVVDAFLHLFDLAVAGVTVGVTTPKLSLLVPAGSSSSVRGGVDKFFNPPIGFGTAITYACTTTPTGADDPSTGLTVNIGYI